ncbi:acyl-CoA N-acyltransferase [Trichoderma camerunense]
MVEEPRRREFGGYVTKKPQKITPIAAANGKTDQEFIRDYIKPSQEWKTWTHPLTQKTYSLEFLSSHELSKDDFRTCFGIIETTSGVDYKNSSVGWHPAMKRKEMKSPDLRYILVKDDGGAVKGFTSLMPTFENHEPVLYCYEVHLLPELQGSGLGKYLMNQLITIAENIPSTKKVMLTCFTSNVNGLKFYEKIGFTKDDFSPRDRTLRGGKVVRPDYVILSRETAHRGLDGELGAIEDDDSDNTEI